MKLVNGRPRHPQSQGCVERANADMKKKVQIWMKENNTSNWGMGLRFVQWQMNNSYHEAIRTKPNRALFGILSRSSQSLKPLSPGDNDAIPVSQFDRSNGDPRNVIGVLLTVHENGLFTVGTKKRKDQCFKKGLHCNSHCHKKTSNHKCKNVESS